MNNNGLRILFIFFLLSVLSCQKGDDLTVNSQEELEEKLKIEMEDNDLTSISYCVVKNDKILYSNAQGFADKANNKLATDNTRYLVASISKTITAVALMKSLEENSISLDDDINQYLPFSVRNPDFPDIAITYRMLLSHTSSISDDFQNNLDLDCYGDDCSMTLEQFFNDVFLSSGQFFSANNFSNNQPGTSEDYSNLASALVGYLVERISETPFDVYCKNNIFTPLGMTKTEWRLSNTPIEELAVPYSSDITSANPHYTFPDYPNGGLRTTVLDLSQFLRAVIQNGTLNSVEILSMAGMLEMKTLQFGSSEQCLSFYYENINNKSVLGHSGGEKGTTTEMYYDTNSGIGVIVFNNDDDAELDNVISLLFNYGEKE
ncbi:MAG: serine hydrolase domain-containing protein [Phaeodactylibacter sp.]|uniref:serine hydrolase domain-containing protein n=1 Tax=Phaeodactylibacter sp. TaxID=1940289 RepID=UPI0032ECD038